MAELVWRSLSVATAFMILFWGLGKSDGQCNIQYNNMALRYGVMGFLQCPSSVPGPARWWRSTEQCDSFIDYSSPQCRDLSCPVFANSSYFYYCCTAPTVNDVLSARDGERSCFRIQICTDVSINSQGSTVAFFNDKVQIFIEMFAEPQPEQNTSIFLTHNTESQPLMDNYTEYEVTTVGDARLVWRYVVQVPDLPSKPNEGMLTFTANFKHSNSDCRQQSAEVVPVTYSIPVYRKEDSPMKTEPPTGSEPDMGGLSTLSASELIGYQAGIGVLSLLLVICFIISIVIALYCWRKQRGRYNSTNPYGVSPGTPMSERPLYGSPGETPMSERPPPPYCREESIASTTHLLRNNYEPNHPTSLPVGGCNYNGHTPTSDIANTPTPTIQSRLLPSTPDDRLPTPLSTNHMETINEERVESANQTPFYACLNENVSLEMQQNNSSAADV